MTYDYKSHKIVAIISDNLESWQAMNVLGHMAISLGANKDAELMGRDVLVDKSNVEHKGIARFGFIVKKGTSTEIKNTIGEARKTDDLTFIDFPRDMLDTRHDDELSESIASKSELEFDYLGVLIYGPADKVNATTKTFELWS